MNREIVVSFLRLRPSEKVSIMQDLDVTLSQGHHETQLEHTKRVLQMIEKQGLMRELENAMRRFQ
jgi:hypothetical protein